MKQFSCGAAVAAVALLLASAPPARVAAQQAQPAPARQPRPQPKMDPERAQKLYVSDNPDDLSFGYPYYQRDIDEKKKTDERFAEVAKAAGIDFQKVKYRSSVGDLDIPAYLFAPMQKRGPHGHAAMVWVHGGVHGNMDTLYWPFIREAVARGYVIVTPDYRGSTGYGEAYHKAIDYGGYEVDDTISAADYLKTLPYVDPDRLGIMGWSHGGFITLHSVFRDRHPFKAAAAIVPVTNLIFRLSMKGPGYQRDYAAEPRIQGLPFEKPDIYIQRSPLYSVDKLQVPLLVHVATNDTDVNYVEDQQIVDALRSRKPNLAETKIYVDPPPGGAGGGHTFSRRVDMKTLERMDTPEQRDSWNRVWAFFEWNLRPYEDGSKPATARP